MPYTQGVNLDLLILNEEPKKPQRSFYLSKNYNGTKLKR